MAGGGRASLAGQRAGSGTGSDVPNPVDLKCGQGADAPRVTITLQGTNLYIPAREAQVRISFPPPPPPRVPSRPSMSQLPWS